MTVSLVRRYAHPVYGKQVTRTKTVKARNDEARAPRPATPCASWRRGRSPKTVRWRVIEIVERAK